MVCQSGIQIGFTSTRPRGQRITSISIVVKEEDEAEDETEEDEKHPELSQSFRTTRDVGPCKR